MVLDTTAYSLIVHAKVKLENLESAWKVYEEMLNRGLQANPYIYTLFIGVHCKKGRIVEAHCLTHLFICDYFRHWVWYNSFHAYRLESCIYGARLCAIT